MLSAKMFGSLTLLATITVQTALACSVSPPSEPPSCTPGLIVDCTQDFEKLIWTKDEENKCRPIQNRCIFNQANCSRYRSKQPLLKEIPQKECQVLCPKTVCSNNVNETLCTQKGEKHCTFPSRCEWSKHLCEKADFWMEVGPISCGENPKPCFP